METVATAAGDTLLSELELVLDRMVAARKQVLFNLMCRVKYSKFIKWFKLLWADSRSTVTVYIIELNMSASLTVLPLTQNLNVAYI
jgi:hypothetical protein